MTAQGNFQRIGDRLRQIPKQIDHLLAGFEMMLKRHPSPVFIRDNPTRRQSQQSIMRLIVVGLGKKRFIGGHKRQSLRIGQIQQKRFYPLLVRQTMTLQLDIETVTKGVFEFEQAGKRQITLPLCQGAVDRPFGATCEANQPFGLAQQISDQDMRPFPMRGEQIGPRSQFHQTGITRITGGQQDKRRPDLGQSIQTTGGPLLFPFDR